MESEQDQDLGQEEGGETSGSEFAQPAESPTAPGGEESVGTETDDSDDAGEGTGEEE